MRNLLFWITPLPLLLHKFASLHLEKGCFFEDNNCPPRVREYLLRHWEQLASILQPQRAVFPDFFIQDRKDWHAGIVAGHPHGATQRPAQLIAELQVFLKKAGRNRKNVEVYPLFYLDIPQFPLSPLALILWRAELPLFELPTAPIKPLPKLPDLKEQYYRAGEGEIFYLQLGEGGRCLNNIHREYVKPYIVECTSGEKESSWQFYLKKTDSSLSLLFLKQEEMEQEKQATLMAVGLAESIIGLYKKILDWKACRYIPGFSMSLEKEGAFRSLAHNIQVLLLRRRNSKTYLLANNSHERSTPHAFKEVNFSLQPGDIMVAFLGSADRKKILQGAQLLQRLSEREIFHSANGSETALGRVKKEPFYRDIAISQEIFFLAAYP